MSLYYILQREPSGTLGTIGKVTVLEEFKWWTCEDVVREPAGRPQPTDPQTATSNLAAWVGSWKVAGQTAIPSGIYRLAFTFSERFQRETIQVLNVPGFSGIRVHAGNTPADTEGCVLVGLERHDSMILQSRPAVARWESEVHAALKQAQDVWLDVRNAERST